MMLTQLAWKNIWRNKVRSLIVVVAIMLGIWAGTFILGYAFGMVEQRLEDAIQNEISHLQIHHPDFTKDNEPQFSIPGSADLLAQLESNQQVKAVSGRAVVFGMINAPSNSSGGKFIGIDPEKEGALTGLPDKIIDGEYLADSDKNKIVIGKKLADKMKVKVRSKLVLTFHDANGQIVAGAFRVKGIYASYNSAIEEMNVYVNLPDLNSLLNPQDPFHEIAILLEDAAQVPDFTQNLAQEHSELLVEDWGELAPDLSFMIESLDQYMIIFLIIILLALSFGIVNTMLMSVLERVREIGMLMAIGMNRRKLFGMICMETVFMVMIAAPVGLLFALATIEYLHVAGMDLSGMYQEGYAAYGFRSMIHPTLETIYYFRILLLVVIMALLSSLYPAITALRLNPVEAIRKI